MPRLFQSLARFADGSYIDRTACDAAFARMHQRDPLGDRIHAALACLGLFLVVGPVTATELAFAPLLVFFFVRAANAGPVWVHGFGQPAVLASLALMAWLGLTLAWSPDRAQGLDEIARLRWFLLPGLIYPAIAHRRAMVTALALGLIVAGIAQLASGLGALRPPFPDRHYGRITGWWDPVVAGSVQVGAIGLFLPAALRGAGTDRRLGTLGLAIATAGLIASGTRGAWLAGLILILIAVPLTLRAHNRTNRRATARTTNRATRRTIAIIITGLLIVAAVGWTQRDGLAIRVDQARSELLAASAGDLDSSTGARVGIMGLAAESGLTHPLGLGAGGIRTAAESRFGAGHAAAHLEHAHSTPLHLWAVGGPPALLLGALLAWVVLRHAVRDAPHDPRRALEAGLPYALASLLLAGLFDAVHLNTHTCALLGALAALCPAYRPAHNPAAHTEPPIRESPMPKEPNSIK